jgi:pyruvate dehydrogenase E2 component (dihydrolipoamide acetyltransferase)
MPDFRMPSLGADMDHGKLVEWLIKPGDYVHRGDVVAVVDTDKTVMDIESFDDGVVAELLVDAGTTVPVGTPLARFTETPDQRSGPGPAQTPPAAAAASPPVQAVTGARVSPPVRHLAHRLGVDAAGLRGTGRNGEVTRGDVERAAARFTAPGEGPAPEALPSGKAATGPAGGEAGDAAAGKARVRSSPRARRLAAGHALDLASVTGTGPGGAVTADDVQRARGARPVQEAEHAAAEPAETAPGERGENLRRAVGALMSRSKQTIPHYYLSTTFDMDTAVSWMRDVNLKRPVSARLVPSALLLKAAALAARDVPEVNGFYVDDHFKASRAVHLGVAVALRKGGIVAPAIHDADTLSVDSLMDGLRDLVARARGGRLQRAEMADPTITVTNLGDLGVESVFGVIYPPQVAMVGLGRLKDQPWAHDGLLGVRPAVTATLSADHRVSDGLRGARYLERLNELLQKPEEL